MQKENHEDEGGVENNNQQLSSPWLLMTTNENQIFFSLVEDRFYTKTIPVMSNSSILCSYRGWLVLSNESSDDCCILNITSMQKFKLPPLIRDDFLFCVISSTPVDHDGGGCRVILISRCLGYVLSCQLGEDEFSKQELILEVDRFLISVINFDGKVYGITYPSYSLVVADFTDPDLRFRELITDESIRNILSYNSSTTCGYLVESNGQLLYVHKTGAGSEVMDFKIFRADFCTRSWVKLQSIGDQAIFLDLWRGVSSPATEHGIDENTIYFTSQGDRNLYNFDIKDQCISMITSTCPTVNSRKRDCSWILIS